MIHLNSFFQQISSSSLWLTPLKEQLSSGYLYMSNQCRVVYDYTKIKGIPSNLGLTKVTGLFLATISLITAAFFIGRHFGSQPPSEVPLKRKLVPHADSKEVGEEEAQYKTLQTDAKELIDLCNEMVEKFDLANQGLSQGLKAKLEAFERNHKKHLGKSGFKSIIFYRDVKKTLEFITGFKPNIFVDPRFGRIIPVPGDGNCLFHALSKGLSLIKDIEEIDHASLREKAIAWIKSHKNSDAVLQEHLASAIENYIAAKTAEFNENIENLKEIAQFESGESIKLAKSKMTAELERISNLTIDQYLELAGQEGFYGTLAEIYAISNLYKVQVRINRIFNGRIFTNLQPPVNEHYGEPFITLSHENGNHFNLALQ